MSGSRSLWFLVAVAVVVLAAGSTLAIAAADGAFDHTAGRRCAAPSLPGTVVAARLSDMGQMMGGNSMMGGGPMMGTGSRRFGGMLWISTNRSTIPSGTTSFRLTNYGAMTHELLVLPLPNGEAAGARKISDDNRVDESSSIGEASRSCGPGEGDGITPDATSWVTLTLAPGRYELLCNLPGHYGAGMFTELTVT